MNSQFVRIKIPQPVEMTILTVYYEPSAEKLGARRDRSKNTSKDPPFMLRKQKGQALYPVSTFNIGFGVTSYYPLLHLRF